jgi:capsular polysaccharide transport system permease protein
MAAVLGLGVGTLNCYLFMAYPINERLWQIATRPLVIVSGLFFLLESVPEPYRDWLWYNPLFHITGEMRNGIFSVYSATYVSYLFVYGLGASLFAIGFLLLSNSYRDLIEK